jgi:hypothetical protein
MSKDLIKEALKVNTQASDGDDPRFAEHDSAPTPDCPVSNQTVPFLDLTDLAGLSDIIIKVHIIPYFDVFRLME